jgi:hypothetical protein
MVLVECQSCDAVHASTHPVCPGCGQCPSCGLRRVTRQQLQETSTCPPCQAPYCKTCGRCHGCGLARFADWPGCSCGFPADPEKVAALEEYCRIGKTPASPSAPRPWWKFWGGE